MTGSGNPKSGSSTSTSLSVSKVSGLRLLELGHGADVALAEPWGGMVLLPLELEQRAEALLALAAEAHQGRIRRHRPLQDAEDVDAPGERVGHGLEHEHRRPGTTHVDGTTSFFAGEGDALDDEVEHGVGAEVLRGDPACDGEDLAVRDGRLERGRDLLRPRAPRPRGTAP